MKKVTVMRDYRDLVLERSLKKGETLTMSNDRADVLEAKGLVKLAGIVNSNVPEVQTTEPEVTNEGIVETILDDNTGSTEQESSEVETTDETSTQDEASEVEETTLPSSKKELKATKVALKRQK